jgi:hypothetical protein
MICSVVPFLTVWIKVKVKVTSIFVSSAHFGPKTRFLLLSERCGFVDVGRPLWREDWSVVYNCCCPSPAQSLSGASPAGLMPIFYCLRFEVPPTRRARVPVFISPRNVVVQLYPQALGSRSKFNSSFRTSQETHYVSATKPNRLMLFREIIAVYCENHTEHINTLCRQNAESFYS